MSHHHRRSVGLDIARGLCLVIMTIDHLDTPLTRFSNIQFGPFGFFTAASAFVFISGFVAARAYGRTYADQGAAAAWRRALTRMSQLYVVNTLMLMALFAGLYLGYLAGPFWTRYFAPFYADPSAAVLKGLTLLYLPGSLSILPMYMLFLLLVTPTLAAVHASRGAWVAWLSALVWALAQAMPHASGFNAFGYQLLFVGGLLLGSIPHLEVMIRSRAAEPVARVCLLVVVVLMACRFWYGVQWLQDVPIPGWKAMTHLRNNGPLRVLDFALFAFVVAHWWPALVTPFRNQWWLKWVAYLGKYSLSVFAWSVVATYVSIALMPEQPSPFWILVDILLTTSSLTLPALVHSKLALLRSERRMRPA
jgi:hypothetical protein